MMLATIERTCCLHCIHNYSGFKKIKKNVFGRYRYFGAAFIGNL